MSIAPLRLLARLFSFVWHLLDGARKVTVNLLFLLVVFIIVAMVFSQGPALLHDRSVLVFTLSGPVVEQNSGSLSARLRDDLGGRFHDGVQLRDVLTVLDAAARDPKIERVLLRLDEFTGAGLPTLREIVAALERVKAAGKQVIAWGAHFDQRQFFIAAHADEVYLDPMGAVYIHGFGGLRNYYAQALDRLGVQANVIQVGRYKNAAEVYAQNGPSKETLESDAALYDALWATYTEAVEQARGLVSGDMAQTIARAPELLDAVDGDTAQFALEAGWVDDLKTEEELRQLLIERGVADERGQTFRQIGFYDYLMRHQVPSVGNAVGVVVAQGEISDGVEGPGRIGGRSTAELIREARENKKIKALVLRVNSPGGSAYGSELVRRELALTQEAGKPVIVSMGDVAASGGYWISLAADEVIADPATVTGSIGVLAMLPTAQGAMDKLELRTGGYGTTWLTNGYDPRTALNPRFEQMVQSALVHIYADFMHKAAKARDTTVAHINEVGQGRVWTGAQAVDHGLIDRLGSYTDALESAATMGGLGDRYRVVYIEQAPDPYARLLGMLGAEVRSALMASLGGTWISETAPLPAVAERVHDDLGALVMTAQQVAQQRKPYAGLVHCFCVVP